MDKKKINGNEEYLHTSPLQKLNVPDSIILPEINKDYNIPLVPIQKGLVGKQLDISPPIEMPDSFE